MSEFASKWTRFHPLGPPIAHILRNAEPKTWVRFHSLPLSKRYATSKREKWTVLERANKLASNILGENSPCWLVQVEYDYGGAANDLDVYGTIAKYRLSFEFKLPSLEDECDYRVYVGPVVWSAGAFDDIITKVADDEVHQVMWVSVATGAVFAPYDGGADLFVPTASEVAKLKGEFSDWLSAHPDGL